MSKQKVRMQSSEISEKWGRNLKHSVPDIQKGLDNVTEAPSAKAIEKQHNVALATGDVEVGQILHLIYDGTEFQLLSQVAQ